MDDTCVGLSPHLLRSDTHRTALTLVASSAFSSHDSSIGFNATMLLCESVSDSNRQIVDCDRLPTPGILRCASALPTSACVTPSLMRRCLKCSANRSSSRGSVSTSVAVTAACSAELPLLVIAIG